MAKLPTRDNLGGLPSGRSGRAIARLDVAREPSQFKESLAAASHMQSGLADLGEGVASFGRVADTLRKHELKQAEFETERKFQEFTWNEERALEERTRSIQPGQARGFADTWQGEYVEKAKSFFKEVPPELKADYEQRLFAKERDLWGAANTFARGEQKRFSLASIGETTNNVFAPRARTTSEDRLPQVAADFDRLIDANPDLTPVEKDELRRKGRTQIALAHIDGLPPDKAVSVLARKQTGGASQNANMAMEFFQSKGMSPEDAAAMTWNFQQESGREMNPRSTHDEGTGFGIAGFRDPTPGKGRWTDLKNFAAKNNLDPNDLKTQLEFSWNELNTTEAGTLAKIKGAQGVSEKAKAAIGYFRPRADYAADRAKRAGEAGSLIGGDGAASVLADIPYEQRDQLLKTAQLKLTQNQTQVASARVEEIERQIIDAASRPNAPLPQRGLIEGDRMISEAQRNTLLRQYDTAAKESVKLQTGLAKFGNPNAGSFNPYSTDDKDVIDKIYKNFGGSQNPAALSAVVQRAGMIPKTAALELRGALASGDEKRVGEALQTLSNLRTRSDVFEGVDGQKDLEQAADQFRHYVDDRGMTAEDATRRIVLNRDPEHKAKIAARIKGENVDDLIKKNLAVSDLEGAFDKSYLPFTDPSIGFNPAQRSEMFRDYAEIAKDHYMQNGDWDLSKKLAVGELKKVWGETNINGKSVIMRYPPEKSPGMSGIENASELIAKQAMADIKASVGKDIPRDKIFLSTIPGLTAQAFKGGRSAPYLLSWQDDNGVIHTLNPGKAWAADPAAARQTMSESRQSSLNAAVAERSAANERVDRQRANVRSIRDASRERQLADERSVGPDVANY